MPNFDGSGSAEVGCMTGRGRGWYGDSPVSGGRRPPRGIGQGMGCGYGFGRGRGQGWASVGYGKGGANSAAANIRLALESRRDFLRAELARTEALIGVDATSDGEGKSEGVDR